MLLFQKRFHEGLVSGLVNLTFRRWPVCRVRSGGRYRCHPIGVLEIDDVQRVAVGEITEAEAARAGFASRGELLTYMASASEEAMDASTLVWRVALHHGGDGDRVALALDDALVADDVQEIADRLDRFDAAEPWTTATLALIEREPRVAASRLAKQVGRDTSSFKANVVKLKKLGLTQSFEVGYEISPRGRAYLAAVAARDSEKAAVARPRAAKEDTRKRRARR
jgi:hypothetical protein